MKTEKWWLLGFSSIFILTACNQDSSSVALDDSNESTPVEEIEEIELKTNTEQSSDETAVEPEETEAIENIVVEEELEIAEGSSEDVLLRSIKVMDELESFTTEVSLTQNISDENGESFVTDVQMTIDTFKNPLAMHQSMKTESTIPGISTLETETYYTEDGIFLRQSEESWNKIATEFTDQLPAIEELGMTPNEEFRLLRDFTESIDLLEKDEAYQIELIVSPGSEKEFKNYAKQIFGAFGEDLGFATDDFYALVGHSSMSYTITINKDTFYQETMELTLTMDIDTDGETATIEQFSFIEFTNFNQVEPIYVPEDIIEHAEELSFNLEDFELELVEIEGFENEVEDRS